jgi:hypothetical protein
MDDKPEFLELGSKEERESTPELTADEISGVERDQPVVTFRGNGYDLTAFVGVIIGLLMLSVCLTCGLIQYILPFIPIILGGIGLAMAKDSVDPERTKLLSWIGLGSGLGFLLLIFLAIAAYIGFIFFIIAAGSGDF